MTVCDQALPHLLFLILFLWVQKSAGGGEPEDKATCTLQVKFVFQQSSADQWNLHDHQFFLGCSVEMKLTLKQVIDKHLHY